MICSREAYHFKAENTVLLQVKNERGDQYFSTNREKVLCDFSHSYMTCELRSACVFHKKENSELVENISEQRKDVLQFDFFSVSSWKLFMKFLKIQTLHRISDLLLKLMRAIKLLKYNISEEKKMGKVGASHSIETIFGVKPFSS